MQTIKIENISSSKSIYIHLTPSDDAHTPSSENSILIAPSSFSIPEVRDGTMNMFVWSNPTSDPIWKGVIPSKTFKTITIDPEKNIVSHGTLQIPSGFEPITDLNDPRLKSPFEDHNKWLKYLFIVFFIVMIILGVLLYTGKIRF